MGVSLRTKNILRLSARERREIGLELSGRPALRRRGSGQAQTRAGKSDRQRAQIYRAGHGDDSGALSSKGTAARIQDQRYWARYSRGEYFQDLRKVPTRRTAHRNGARRRRPGIVY